MEFCDLKTQYLRYQAEIDSAMQSVIASAAFIHGPEVSALEKDLSEFCGAAHAVACANGTDALHIPLLALGVRPGDEIIVPDFTFYATSEMAALAGAVPVFADIDPETYLVTPETVAAKITPRTVGVIPVSLFGQMPDLEGINRLAEKRGLWVIEDAAQSFGAAFKGRRSCSATQIATTSFFPAKPLGAYGDGGAMFTSDGNLAEKLRIIANHGSRQRYRHQRIGVNSRLDSLQAAVLRVKLRHFESELRNRDRSAALYTEKLQGRVVTPVLRPGNSSSWAQYTIRVANREKVQDHLRSKGIPTAVHYPLPLHAQEAFAALRVRDAECPEATRAAREVLSLPMHGHLSDADLETVCAALLEVC